MVTRVIGMAMVMVMVMVNELQIQFEERLQVFKSSWNDH